MPPFPGRTPPGLVLTGASEPLTDGIEKWIPGRACGYIYIYRYASGR